MKPIIYINQNIVPKIQLDDTFGEVLIEGTKRITNYWVSAGTALGLYRDGDYVKGDNDIDIEMIGFPQIEEYLKVRIPFDVYRTVHYEDRLMQIAFSIRGVIFDVYVYYPDGDYFINHNENGVMKVPNHFYYNREIINTKYGWLPFPKPIKEYMKFRYGKEWKTPKDCKGIYNGTF